MEMVLTVFGFLAGAILGILTVRVAADSLPDKISVGGRM